MISNQFILPHFSTKTNCRAAIFYAKPALPTVYAEPYGRGRCGAFFCLPPLLPLHAVFRSLGKICLCAFSNSTRAKTHRFCCAIPSGAKLPRIAPFFSAGAWQPQYATRFSNAYLRSIPSAACPLHVLPKSAAYAYAQNAIQNKRLLEISNSHCAQYLRFFAASAFFLRRTLGFS